MPVTFPPRTLSAKGSKVVPNPEMEGNEPKLTGLEIDGEKYDVTPEALTDAEVDLIWAGGYTITATITNGSASGDEAILFDAEVTITPSAGYVLPETVVVEGADSEYDPTTGVVTLTNATANVTVTATCPSEV